MKHRLTHSEESMRILESLDSFDKNLFPKPVLALGNFDGVHLGHQKIFQYVAHKSQEIGGTGMVFTFDPHPLQILAPEKSLLFLTTYEQKMQLIEALGIPVGLRIRFNETFAQQQPVDFVREVLCHSLGIDELVVGYDFRFGHRRTGTTTSLQELAPVYGYKVTVIPAIALEETVVSSSTIRRLLQEGDVAKAARLLGRRYTIIGTVVEGFQRGRTIGFPTANVRSVNALVPQTGVYAVRVLWEGCWYPAVANIGYNPTFGNQALSIEAHLFDFQADLYGATVQVEFVAHIRPERKFASVDELKAQIACDSQQARLLHARRPAST